MTESKLLFFTEGITFNLRHKKKVRKWIYTSMEHENKVPGSINFIFCDDNYLHNINLQYLKHDTLTDIITFDYSEDIHSISGDIFISIERIKENAKQFKVSFVDELSRVMIHGMLHLVGYKDKTAEEKKLMRSKEDYYISLQPAFFRE